MVAEAVDLRSEMDDMRAKMTLDLPERTGSSGVWLSACVDEQLETGGFNYGDLSVISDGFERTARRAAGASGEDDIAQGYEIVPVGQDEHLFIYIAPVHLADFQNNKVEATKRRGSMLAGRVRIGQGPNRGEIEASLVDVVKL